jgi:hypothetical protein
MQAARGSAAATWSGVVWAASDGTTESTPRGG